MSDETEEKKFPPTPAKLKRARKEGRVPHSRDLVLLSMLPPLLWLYFNWPVEERSIQDILRFAFRQDFTLPAEDITRRVLPALLWMAFEFVLPLMIIAVIVVFVLSIGDNGGMIFSAKPVTPDFGRLNPANGFKKIFSMRSAAESGFGLVKMGVFTLVTLGILTAGIGTIVRAQVCGAGCLGDAFHATVTPIIAAFIALLLILAVMDFILSRQLFRHEMRMSHSELKRENKDVYGSPEVKRRQRDEGRERMHGPARLGTGAATVLIQGREVVVGLRYVPGETAAPVVVVKGTGAGAEEVLDAARSNGVPIAVNLVLARTLYDRGFLGQFIPQDTFTAAAGEIIKSGG